MKHVWPRVRSVFRVLFRARQLEADMHDEMRFHIQMEAERLERERGLDREEARRQAYVAFGGVEKYKEAGRDSRGRQWLDSMALDWRLGVRMLVKFPGLTLVGSFALAVAIAIGAMSFEVITTLLHSTLPFDEGDRIVAIQFATGNVGNPERRVLHEFYELRDELRSVQQLGAYRTVEHNLVRANRTSEPITVAEMSASGFTIARTPPAIGRYLVAEDERAGSPAVIVIGHDAWHSRFAGDPAIVGQTIRLGAIPHLVVGVMPRGFKFPVAHQFWIPFRVDPAHHKRLEGPSLQMFGRLAAGVAMTEAQTELTAIGQRLAAAHPETHARLRPTVLSYTREYADIDHPVMVWALWMLQAVITALLVVVAVNLAILVYARTVARTGELAMRSALGASRHRILTQLFMEAFALSAVGALAGLVMAQFALDWIQALISSIETMPFWMALKLTPLTVIYGVGLAVLAAVIAGVVPGLRLTTRELHNNLRELSGSTGARLGRTWTTLVVAQVAIAVAILPVATFTVWEVARLELADPPRPVDSLLVAAIEVDNEASSAVTGERARRDLFRKRQSQVIARLEAEPRVSSIAFAAGVPGFEGSRSIEFAPDAGVPGVLEANVLRVSVGTFEAFRTGMLTGRALDARDVGGTTNAVVVNRTFVRRLLGNGAALGHRFRYPGRASRVASGQDRNEWYEIVGVVDDFPALPPQPWTDAQATVYHAAVAGDFEANILIVRVRDGDAAGYIPRLRQIAAEIDPTFALQAAKPLQQYRDEQRSLWRFAAWGLALVTSSVLLLSAAGIYALMSFTVAQRTREIGIRTALGAHPRRLLVHVFARVTRQLAIGALIGSVSSGVLLVAAGIPADRALGVLAAVAAIALLVGLLGATGPARRGLRVHASEALRTG